MYWKLTKNVSRVEINPMYGIIYLWRFEKIKKTMPQWQWLNFHGIVWNRFQKFLQPICRSVIANLLSIVCIGDRIALDYIWSNFIHWPNHIRISTQSSFFLLFRWFYVLSIANIRVFWFWPECVGSQTYGRVGRWNIWWAMDAKECTKKWFYSLEIQ